MKTINTTKKRNNKSNLFADSHKFADSHRSSGQAMLLTVILLSTAILGATALVGLLMTYQIRNSADTVASAQAIFAADAGIECALYQHTKDDTIKCGSKDDPTNNPPIELSNGATYRIRLVQQGDIEFAQSVGQSRRTARAFQIPLPLDD